MFSVLFSDSFISISLGSFFVKDFLFPFGIFIHHPLSGDLIILLRWSSFVKYFLQLFQKSFPKLNGEGGIWTLAPLSRPAPFPGVSLRPAWVLLHKVRVCPRSVVYVSDICTRLRYIRTNCVILKKRKILTCRHRRQVIWSGEGGIRTHAPFRTNGFQDRLVMTASIPLQNARSRGTFNILPFRCGPVKNFFKFSQQDMNHLW